MLSLTPQLSSLRSIMAAAIVPSLGGPVPAFPLCTIDLRQVGCMLQCMTDWSAGRGKEWQLEAGGGIGRWERTWGGYGSQLGVTALWAQALGTLSLSRWHMTLPSSPSSYLFAFSFFVIVSFSCRASLKVRNSRQEGMVWKCEHHTHHFHKLMTIIQMGHYHCPSGIVPSVGTFHQLSVIWFDAMTAGTIRIPRKIWINLCSSGTVETKTCTYWM